MTFRTEAKMIGLGIGFLVFGWFVLPFILDATTTSYAFMEYKESNKIIQLINTYAVGTVYVAFGLLLVIWKRRTQSKQIPYNVVVFTSGVTIAAIIGIWMYILFPSGTPQQTTVFGGSIGNVTRTVFNPAVLIGYVLLWMIISDFASTGYQRILATAGVVTVPLMVFVLAARSIGGIDGSALVFLFLLSAIIGGIIVILAYIYGLPLRYLLKEQARGTTNT